MRKLKLLTPLLIGGLVLAGCESASSLHDVFTSEDLVVNSPWKEYVMPATAIEFATGEESIELNRGDKHTFEYELTPKGATSNSLTWVSSDESVATVKDGVVTAVGPGETTLTVNGQTENFEALELAVKVNVPLVDFTLQDISSSVTEPTRLEQEESYTFDVEFEPSDTTNTDLTYEIVDPSPEGVAIVSESGVVTTGSTNGTATLRVKNVVSNKTHDYYLQVQKIEVESIVLSSQVTEVEINKTLATFATVTPSNASDIAKKGLKFYSKDPEIATIDESTGVVTGVSASPSPARIYATVGNAQSADYPISVFEVHATDVTLNTTNVALQNYEDVPKVEQQLEWTFTTDKAGIDVPSRVNITFASGDESVATVTNEGLIRAVGAGSTTVTMTAAHADGTASVVKNVNVSVDFRSKSLVISGGTSLYNDETLTLTATLTPSAVTDPTINWTIDDTSVATLSSSTGSSVTLSPHDEDATGTVTVTATNVNGASSTATISVSDRVSEFAAGQHYIVGNRAYNTGESRTGKTSWDKPKYAYHFTNRTGNASLLEEFKGTIHFEVGDEFRYRFGPEYVNIWEDHEGWAERDYHVENAGALADGSMMYAIDGVASESKYANVHVNVTGWYDLYAKIKKNDDGSTCNALYVQKVPAMTSELSELTMGLEDTYQVVLHDYIGEVTYSVTSGSSVSVSASGLISALALGSSTVTATDARESSVNIDVTIADGASGVSRTIYLNSNGKLDSGTPFIWAWKNGDSSVVASATKMSKVGGQDIVYEASIPVVNDYVIFADCSQANFDWSKVSKQTVDLALEAGKDMFTARGSEDGKVTGGWSTFDSAIHYEVEIEAPYIFYNNGLDWIRHQLVPNPGNENEVMGSLDLNKNAEFAVCLESGWLHFEDIKAGSAIEVVQGAESDGVHNFKANARGAYTLYVDTSINKVYVAYAGSFTVSFNANGGSGTMASSLEPSGSYTLPANGFTAPAGKYFDGWKANNAGASIAAGGTYTLSDDVTFYAQWSETPYVPNNVTLYLTANWGWEHPYAYVFDHDNSDTSKADFPGESMTYVGVNDDNDTIFSYTVDINTYDYIIFATGDPGDKYQTVDIDISSCTTGSAFYFSGRVDNDENKKITVGTWTYAGASSLTTKQIVYFTNSKYWSDPHFHFFKNGTGTTWPGLTPGGENARLVKWMYTNDMSQDVYRLLFDTSTYDSFIFNGSGGSIQTKDIAISSLATGKNGFYIEDGTDGSGHYNVGQWTRTYS